MIVFHLARADNGVIGAGGTIPWRIPGEQRRFKAMTMGKPMIMGRKTFGSFPAPLPGRRHIVLTRSPDWVAAGAEVVHDVDAALALAGPEASVIGGADIFDLFLPHAARIELTEVHLSPAGDAVVPPFDGWREIAREDFPMSGDVPAYSYVTLAPPAP
ncbi:MAG: dihydrofolate reductase [Sphingomonas sp.]|nr:dihydrofolate reductase [Sphingomonas sp.]